MLRGSRTAIEIKTPGELALMREAGLVVARTLRAVCGAVEPGITTAELDAIAAREISDCGAQPSFLGYHGYPATICTSVNDRIVHGIPRADEVLAAGDIISVDAGAIVGGWHGDAAVTVAVGEVTGKAAALIEACELALWQGLRAALAGGHLTDVAHAIETSARSSGEYGVIREYTGHFIGSQMHMDPPVPNYGKPGHGPVLAEGMALAVEPMLVLGERYTDVLDDGWTVVTADGSLAAHFEHTVAITESGPWVLTAEDGGQGWLAQLAETAGGQSARVAGPGARSA